ncbi:uncharacterized protein LOC132551242 [Ylistrum balloti]|uniref:uncharacterized protein LOC132551242 n=1 Tax=Ylistrum balloti TaxID=509963 RepID=UPI0029058135|nr:uncharacterized protein LOC132551242 [Ylistrum balloti]
MGGSVIGILFYILSYLCVTIYGHARLWEPPARSTMWRRGFSTPVNTNDNELNCGGYENLWIKYSGMCGICGDPYQQHPRENEAGGTYATGTVSRHYKTGDVVTFSVDVTANHEGYFEFRLCPSDGVVSQACLDRHPVPVIGHPDGRYHLKAHENGIIDMKVKLPAGLACDKCLLQWRYRTGNRWNCDQKSNKCGKGLGPQEEFYGCADISILDFRLAMALPVSKPVNAIGRMSVRTQKPGVRMAKRPTKAVRIRQKMLNTATKPVKSVKFHQNTIPKRTLRKTEQLNDLSGVLWKLLKGLTNKDPSGGNIALVKWDPVSRAYKSNIVYVRPKVEQLPHGQTGRMSVNNVRSNWPPVQPMIVEATIDQQQTGPVLLSDPPFDQVLKKQILPSVFDNLKNTSTCHGVNNFAKVSGIAKWCTVNCKAGNCPSVMCTCTRDNERAPAAIKPVSVVSRPRPFRPVLRSRVKTNHISFQSQPSTSSGLLRCKGIGHFSRDKQIISWCNSNCNKGFCPKHMCFCI